MLKELLERFDNQRIIITNGIIYELDTSDYHINTKGNDCITIYCYNSLKNYYKCNYFDTYDLELKYCITDIKFIKYIEGEF